MQLLFTAGKQSESLLCQVLSEVVASTIISGPLLYVQGMNGQLEFFNADDFEPMSAAEHFMCTDIEWDPTGRFVATSVGHVHQMENGFNLWLFNGQELYQ